MKVKVGDLVKHKSFDDLYGVVTSADYNEGLLACYRVEVLWTYDPGYGRHTPHHPDRLEVIVAAHKVMEQHSEAFEKLAENKE